MQKTLFSYFENESKNQIKHCTVQISSTSVANCIKLFYTRYKDAVCYYIEPLIN